MTVRIAVVTGTRAEFGLLEPVMLAIKAQEGLELQVYVTGTHLIGDEPTIGEVADRFDITTTFPMQIDWQHSGRRADAAALGRGITGMTGAIVEYEPDCVVVLGDRIEAFAAASAASIAGIAVAHIHGGDRAEGVADEAMRHAITKLAHLHFPATEESANRIERMGENTASIQVVGSPAIDGIASISPMSPDHYEQLGSPQAVLLLHPVGFSDDIERATAQAAIDALADRRVLALHPNHDAGREGIVEAIKASGIRFETHLPRDSFVGLLKALALLENPAGLLVGNSSAGLIEAAALRLPVINIGPRQSGRERPDNVVDCDVIKPAITDAIRTASLLDRASIASPYGNGEAGKRIAAAIAATDLAAPPLLRKRSSY